MRVTSLKKQGGGEPFQLIFSRFSNLCECQHSRAQACRQADSCTQLGKHLFMLTNVRLWRQMTTVHSQANNSTGRFTVWQTTEERTKHRQTNVGKVGQMTVHTLTHCTYADNCTPTDNCIPTRKLLFTVKQLFAVRQITVRSQTDNYSQSGKQLFTVRQTTVHTDNCSQSDRQLFTIRQTTVHGQTTVYPQACSQSERQLFTVRQTTVQSDRQLFIVRQLNTGWQITVQM